MHVFVTGAGGMIGRATVRHLSAQGHTVVALVRRPRDITFGHPNIRWVLGDVRNPSILQDGMKNCDAVVHLAARKSDEPDSRAINVEGTRNMLQAANEAKIKHVIQISTISTKFKDRGTYGQTKSEADEWVMKSPLDTTILKLSVVYADLDSGIFGSLARYAKLPFVPLVGPGLSTSRPIYVDDVAIAIEKIVRDPSRGHKVYELGGPEIVTLNELTEKIAQEVRHGHARILHIPLWLGFVIARIFSILPKAPITRSNIVGMNAMATVATEAFYKRYQYKARTIEQGLAHIRQQSAAMKTEAYAIMRYISGGQTSDFYVDLYRKALARHLAQKESERPAVSSMVLGALDAITKFTAPRGTLRTKLAIAAAIYETSPMSADMVLPQKRSLVAVVFTAVRGGISSVFKLLLGSVLRFTAIYADHT